MSLILGKNSISKEENWCQLIISSVLTSCDSKTNHNIREQIVVLDSQLRISQFFIVI